MGSWLLRNYVVDVWTLVHVVVFFLTFLFLGRLTGVRRMGPLVKWALVIGIGWEITEARIEHLWTPYGEPWWNRWVTDPLADGLGAVLAWSILRKRPGSSI